MKNPMWADRQRARLNVLRKRRLLSKVQKAGVAGHLPEILAAPSWNSKFNTVQRLRVMG